MGTTTSTPQELQAAEQALAEGLGIHVDEHVVTTAGPVRHVRVLESGAGAPVVLVHGGGGIAAQWLPLMAAMPGHRCLAIERPGCGLTEGYTYRDDEDVRAHATAYLGGVLDALGIERADVVANSMGALWSLWLALDHPERVRTLTTVGCPALVVDTSAPFAMRLISRRGFNAMLRRPQDARGMARVLAMLGHDADRLERAVPGLVETTRLGGNLPGAGASFASLLQRVVTLRGGREDCSLSASQLRDLVVDPLVLWGATDPFGDLDAARRFTDATGGTFQVVGTGHLPWLDEPAEVAAAVAAYLAAVDTPTP